MGNSSSLIYKYGEGGEGTYWAEMSAMVLYRVRVPQVWKYGDVVVGASGSLASSMSFDFSAPSFTFLSMECLRCDDDVFSFSCATTAIGPPGLRGPG